MKLNRRLDALEQNAGLLRCPHCSRTFVPAGHVQADVPEAGPGLLEEMADEIKALRNWRPPAEVKAGRPAEPASDQTPPPTDDGRDASVNAAESE
jgi:hypothetical protein